MPVLLLCVAPAVRSPVPSGPLPFETRSRKGVGGGRALKALLVCGLLAAATAWPTEGTVAAQSRTTSAVRGTVVRQDGTPLMSATVSIRQVRTGAERRAVSNAEGRFLFPLLQPGGPYELAVSLIGFAHEQRDSIFLAVGEILTLDVTLQVQTLEVAGLEVVVDRAAIFSPGQIGPATRLTERTVEAMPILSRNIMELAVLSPLVKTTESGGFSVAGQNDRYNALLVDGIGSKDLFGLSAGGVPGGQAGAKLIPIDAVAQFEVLVAPFDVRLSGFTGGVLNAVTRSGTNDLRIRVGAVHRAEALMGDLTLPTGPVDASGVDRSLVAFSIGGPIVRDRAHFFVAGEFEERGQPPIGFNLYRDDPLLVRISPPAIQELDNLFDTMFGLQIGEAGAYRLGQQLSNVFARVDWDFASGTRLMVRNLFSLAENDRSPNRLGGDPYGLASNAVSHRSLNNTASIQLLSQLGDWASNELDLNVQRTTDRSLPASDWPQVEVELLSSIGNSGFRRPARVGAEYFSQLNEVEQTSFRFTNSLNLQTAGGSTVTVGVAGSYHDINQLFLPGAAGEYYFASPNDLRNNAPQRYQRTILAEGESPWVKFQVAEWGAFIQYELHASDGLTMRFGLRADVPHVLGSPEENPDIMNVLGRSTSNLPSGNLLLSPRWGFNWQSDARRQTQVRAGAGMFTGQIPYVWLANAFHNNGLRSHTQVCLGRLTDDPMPGSAVPAFDPWNPPTGCMRSDFMERRAVVLFQEGFVYPKDLKFSLAVDQELSGRISGSLGVLFNKAISQVALEDLNIERGGPTHSSDGFGDPGRNYYRPLTENHAGRVRVLPAYDEVLLVTNNGEDWGASFTAELRGQITQRFQGSLGYAWSGSWDRTSLTFSDMISNYGTRPTAGDPSRPGLTRSNFDRPHKIVVALLGSPVPGLPDTEVSLLYTGQSGLPFSYVYRFDLNGDGFPGFGGAFDRNNDIIYVPHTGSELAGSIVTQGLVERALTSDRCLGQYRGQMLPRNGCRAPWQNRLDLRLGQTVRLGGADVRFSADLINVLNLLDGTWGTVESIRPAVPLFEECKGCETLAVTWGGAVLTSRNEDGRLIPTDPWNVVSPDSQWQAQFGVRVTFGGRR